MFHVTFSLVRQPGQAVNSSNQEVIPMKPFTCSRRTPHKTPVVHRTLTLLPLLVLFLGFGAAFAQWGPDVRLTYDPYNSVTGPLGAANTTWTMAASGDTVHVIWLDGRGGTDNLEVWYKRSTNQGITWGTDTRLESDPLSFGSGNQCVAASGSTVHVVWDRMYTPDDYRVFYKRSTDGGTTWGPEIQFTNPNEANNDPIVAASGPVVHAVWTFSTPSSQDIIYKRSTDGGATWGPTSPIIEGWMPSMAVSGSNVHVVCLGRGVYDLFYTHSTDGGATWSPAVRLTDDPDNSLCPSIAVPSQNRVHVTWEDDRDGHREIYYKRSTDGGTNWGPDTRLTYSPSLSEFACVAASGANVHVVWYDWRGGEDGIYYKRSTDGGTSWGQDTVLVVVGPNNWPSLALSGSKVHVVWTDMRDGNFEIYYKRNPTGNPTGVEEETAEVRGKRLEVRLKTVPNPFTSFARILGHEGERFAIYDISGRMVGTYKGDRIGEGLSAGVYFLRSEDKNAKPLRIVKVR